MGSPSSLYCRGSGGFSSNFFSATTPSSAFTAKALSAPPGFSAGDEVLAALGAGAEPPIPVPSDGPAPPSEEPPRGAEEGIGAPPPFDVEAGDVEVPLPVGNGNGGGMPESPPVGKLEGNGPFGGGIRFGGNTGMEPAFGTLTPFG